MGCGSSSLKGSEDVGTNAPTPAVPNNNNLQPAGGAPVKKVKTNFSNIDYDAPTETHKDSLLKARAPDELDEGPSRNASYAGPTAGTGTGTGAGNLQGESKDAILEEEQAAEKNPPEPYDAKKDEPEPEAKPTSDEQQIGGKIPDFVQ
jgi:hypothetical protein